MIAQMIDLLTDHEMVTASADPRVIPPLTDSFTFPDFAIVIPRLFFPKFQKILFISQL